ncbi:sigma-54-dependent transcriptional regulator [Longimicrobium terrae]|uniref:Two-component system response regulator AtoC n=1 Tax=Longimicrobium terrae TaxID=1639882 RepID=A0A841H681_9BACT|nr:sigma-54 dependent transcriptional regulator [Longimicrobium terrae]MBB4639220.1 two-component system response regulator AtoC [Longimicrobium terrae]MBB6073376.1 two-component system response regulator AtoC [Longimicrobium terrae]NNC32636.1 sigma-54-dependent Fis family transcriptional regulator [Longimicrobium terrae]
MSNRRVLVIDDEAGLRHTLLLILRDEGYTVQVAEDGEAGLRMALAEPPDLVLCDVRMPRMGGLEFLERYQRAGGPALVIMMSAYGTLDAAVEAMRGGAYDYISKPFNADEVILTLRKAEEREQLQREVARLRREVGEVAGFEHVVGVSGAMKEVMELAGRVAPFPSTVLLTGESGSGKEAIARAVHRASPRRDRAFVAVNCGAIPENLLESELFGHERGAFTGADRMREGLFEEADGGTLFLDEIGELPLSLQVKLLRVLQERTIRRVGGTGEKAVDVRVLTATARDLVDEVREGRFREDLFYRINVVQIHIPPLRTRPEDVPPLAEHFLRRHAPRLGIDSPPLPRDLVPVLAAYSWPGNVRELENVMERALVLSGGAMTVDHLPPHVRTGRHPFQLADDAGDLSVKRRLPALEKSLISRALERCGGNRTRAADLLELSVRALSYKIRDYGLE